MVDYGTGSFTLANLGNPATGPDDVFQCNPGDSGHRNPGNIYVSYNLNSAAPEVPEFVDDVVGDEPVWISGPPRSGSGGCQRRFGRRFSTRCLAFSVIDWR